MSFKRVFRKKSSSAVLYERDNMGRYAQTVAQANKYFDVECADPFNLPPFTVFWFRTKRAAEKAFLKMPFFHRAADSGKLICELSITYGIYKVPHEKGYAAFVLGFAMELEGFEIAEKAFSHYGVFKNHELPDGAKERFKVKYNRWTKEWVHWD